MPKLVIGADIEALPSTKLLAKELARLEYKVCLAHLPSEQHFDYPDVAQAVCEKVLRAPAATPEYGILVCGSGIGMSIAANKVAGIRAAVATSTDLARSAVLHDRANVLCLGWREKFESQLRDIVVAFLEAHISTPASHSEVIEKLAALDRGHKLARAGGFEWATP